MFFAREHSIVGISAGPRGRRGVVLLIMIHCFFLPLRDLFLEKGLIKDEIGTGLNALEKEM
jgi:hypothetical protein